MRTLRIAIFGVLAVATVGGFYACRSAAGAVAKPQSSTTKKKAKKKHATKHEQGQKAPTPDRISEIQAALAKGGYYQGDPNGKWDSDTIAAVEKFQSSHGIDASGKLDAPTLQKLGLGSGIAGVSAPHVPQSTPSTTPSGSGSPSSAAPANTLSPSASNSTPNSASSVSPGSNTSGTGSALK